MEDGIKEKVVASAKHAQYDIKTCTSGEIPDPEKKEAIYYSYKYFFTFLEKMYYLKADRTIQ